MRVWMLALVLTTGCVGQAFLEGDGGTDPDDTGDAALDSGDPAGDSGSGDSGSGDTGSGDTGSGDTGSGDSGNGDTGSGDSGSGDTGSGDSGNGDTGAGDSGTGDSGAGDSGSSGCTATHRVIRPVHNSVDVPVDVEMEIEFGQDERNSLTLTLTNQVTNQRVPLAPVQWAPNGRLARTRALGDLAYDTRYRLQGTYSCGGQIGPIFVTEEQSEPPVTPDEIRNRTYAVDLGSGRVVEPAGLGSLLGPQLANAGRDLMIRVTRVQGAVLDILVGTAEPTRSSWDQPRCEPTTPVDDLDLGANPVFRGVVDELGFELGGIPVTLQDARLTGRFLDDGDEMDLVGFAGRLDIRPIASIFGSGSTPQQLCQTLPFVTNGAVSCGPCPDGTGNFCIPMSVQELEGVDAAPFALQTRTSQQIRNDPQCRP
ncbi:MAG: pentapeptide repeat-containing protein [Alphaproteobacteria bacterium]|nr:pentapeptide repeat-containing protein [Alphaproteobacteria bacterium]